VSLEWGIWRAACDTCVRNRVGNLGKLTGLLPSPHSLQKGAFVIALYRHTHTWTRTDGVEKNIYKYLYTYIRVGIIYITSERVCACEQCLTLKYTIVEPREGALRVCTRLSCRIVVPIYLYRKLSAPQQQSHRWTVARPITYTSYYYRIGIIFYIICIQLMTTTTNNDIIITI